MDLPAAPDPDTAAASSSVPQQAEQRGGGNSSNRPTASQSLTSRAAARSKPETTQVASAAAEQAAVHRSVSKEAESYNAENRMLFFAKVLRSATEGEVKALFGPYGRVYDVNLFRAFQGAPTTKGCGLVTMGSHDEAQAAINALDNKYVWDGMESPMVVKWMDAALQRRRREQHLAAMRSGLIPSHSMGSASTMPDNWLPTGFALANMLPQSRSAVLGLSGSSAAMMGPELEPPEHPPAGCHPDAIKLFVGNIPKSCTEQQLLPFFETVGKVVELVIVRDKTFHESKGSAFVWYATRALAERAILQFNLRHVLPDPSGEQTRPLVVRKAKMRSMTFPMLPMSLNMMAGAPSQLLEPHLQLSHGPSPMAAQQLMGMPQHMHYAQAGGPGLLGSSLDSLQPPPPPPPPHGLAVMPHGIGGMVNPVSFGMLPVGGPQHMPGLQTAGPQPAHDGGLYEAYGAGAGTEQFDSLLQCSAGTSDSGGVDVDQVIMSAAVSQNQLSIINSHLFSIKAMSGAQLNIMIGAPGVFHLVVSGTKAQVDSARALLYSVMGSR